MNCSEKTERLAIEREVLEVFHSALAHWYRSLPVEKEQIVVLRPGRITSLHVANCFAVRNCLDDSVAAAEVEEVVDVALIVCIFPAAAHGVSVV